MIISRTMSNIKWLQQQEKITISDAISFMFNFAEDIEDEDEDGAELSEQVLGNIGMIGKRLPWLSAFVVDVYSQVVDQLEKGLGKSQLEKQQEKLAEIGDKLVAQTKLLEEYDEKEALVEQKLAELSKENARLEERMRTLEEKENSLSMLEKQIEMKKNQLSQYGKEQEELKDRIRYFDEQILTLQESNLELNAKRAQKENKKLEAERQVSIARERLEAQEGLLQQIFSKEEALQEMVAAKQGQAVQEEQKQKTLMEQAVAMDVSYQELLKKATELEATIEEKKNREKQSEVLIQSLNQHICELEDSYNQVLGQMNELEAIVTQKQIRLDAMEKAKDSLEEQIKEMDALYCQKQGEYKAQQERLASLLAEKEEVESGTGELSVRCAEYGRQIEELRTQLQDQDYENLLWQREEEWKHYTEEIEKYEARLHEVDNQNREKQEQLEQLSERLVNSIEQNKAHQNKISEIEENIQKLAGKNCECTEKLVMLRQNESEKQKEYSSLMLELQAVCPENMGDNMKTMEESIATLREALNYLNMEQRQFRKMLGENGYLDYNDQCAGLVAELNQVSGLFDQVKRSYLCVLKKIGR